MQIPVNHFEDYIDEVILERGLSYFKKGKVIEQTEISKGEYEFIVMGSDRYVVRLSIKENIVKDYVCDCPYDRGAVCKHVAASLFFLQQDVLGLNQKPEKTKAKTEKKTAKPKSVMEKVNELLGVLSYDDIKQFIREKAGQDSDFRNMFFTAFAHKSSEESKEFYVKQVSSILSKGIGREGFIDWSAVRYVGKAVGELLTTAQKYYDNKNYKSAIYICCAVMEEMTDALQYADDSNGDIGGSIDIAYDILFNIVIENQEEDLRRLLFEYCVTSFKEKIFSDWDWHFGMLNMAVKIFKGEEEANRITSLLEKEQLSEYDESNSQSIKLEIIEKTKGKDEAEKYIEQNISNFEFRCKVIKKAIAKKNYENAISLAKDGIAQDKTERPGRVKYWIEYLLNIAERQNDSKKIIEYAKVLFKDDNTSEKDYYALLKKNVQPEKWNEFVEGLINDLFKNKYGWNSDRINDIYIREGWWERLYESVKEHPTLSNIQYYEKYLKEDFKEEIISLYESGILNFLKGNVDRGNYKEACRYLRRMIKLGAREKVNEIIEHLRKEYPRRPALLDELNKV